MALFLSILPMVGCETIKVLDNGCAWTDYIYVSVNDTEETLRQAATHNLTRKEICE